MTTRGSLPHFYQWRKDGANLVETDRITGVHTPSLSIQNAVVGDSGHYSLYVTNAHGTVTSTNACVLVTGLDHFSWTSIPITQLRDVPFTVTVRAEDESNQLVTNYNEIVALSAFSGWGGESYTLLDIPLVEFTAPAGLPETIAYSFTPSIEITVVGVRHSFGSKISLWTDSGILLAEQPVHSFGGIWQETPLSVPIPLQAGVSYRVGSYVRQGLLAAQSELPPAFIHGSIDGAYRIEGDGFPEGGTSVAALADLRYFLGPSHPVPMTTASEVHFVNGLWTGEITLAEAGPHVTLRADSTSGFTGISTPINVIDFPVLRADRRGDTILLSWPAALGKFQLEATDSLQPASWHQVEPGAAVAGDSFELEIPMTNRSRFYRLHHVP